MSICMYVFHSFSLKTLDSVSIVLNIIPYVILLDVKINQEQYEYDNKIGSLFPCISEINHPVRFCDTKNVIIATVSSLCYVMTGMLSYGHTCTRLLMDATI